MRILHVIPTYVPAWRYGGPVRSVHGLARAQVAAGDRVSVFTTNADGAGELVVPTDRVVELDGVEVSYFPIGWPRRLGRSPALGVALERRIAEFDVVHLHSVFLWPTWVAARSARGAGVAYFVSPRGMLVGDLIRERGTLRKRLWIAAVERRTLIGAAAIVVTSELERREIERLGLGLAPFAVVPNGIVEDAETTPGSIDEVRASFDTDSFQPMVLYLGRLSWKKGLAELVEAIAAVPEARCLIAGNDDEKLWPELERRARTLGAGERLRYVGEVRGEAKRRLLAAARAFVLPSLSENFGVAALEAMAAGVPVVLGPGVGIAAAATAAGAGLVAREPEELRRAIAELLGEPARSRAMGERGRALAARDYGWPAIAAAMRELYTRRGSAAARAQARLGEARA